MELNANTVINLYKEKLTEVEHECILLKAQLTELMSTKFEETNENVEE